jgi:hypothetical protein
VKRPTQKIAKANLTTKGELAWSLVPMKKWQVEMVKIAVRAAAIMCPVKYVGDFLNFWWKQAELPKTGNDHEDLHSLEFRAYTHLRKPRTHHKGD